MRLQLEDIQISAWLEDERIWCDEVRNSVMVVQTVWTCMMISMFSQFNDLTKE